MSLAPPSRVDIDHPVPSDPAVPGVRVGSWAWVALGVSVPVVALIVLAAAVATLGLPRGGTAEALAATVSTHASTGSGASSGGEAVLVGLHPGLVAAYTAAEAAAADAGHHLTINSGYRTPEHQQRLLDEAIVEHGSEQEALRWVFTPERSMHVRGLAIDVGDGAAAEWLDDHGSRWGLCRTLDWEWWHFEWRAAWEADGICPRPVHVPEDAPGENDS